MKKIKLLILLLLSVLTVALVSCNGPDSKEAPTVTPATVTVDLAEPEDAVFTVDLKGEINYKIVSAIRR